MKVVQLQELLDVRHSVFIVGNAGTGKTKIWQTLRETYRIQKLKPVCHVLNPKALSNDELFGIVNPTTREWKDGLFSSIMREQANMPPGNPKWIVLDGDIDPMWIESLNTLMDDNKILTLASNERISLNEYLLDKLTHWQKVLGGIDTLIVNWFEVQRKWIYLECIFIGSADIRAQLPADAANFERIDKDFTELLAKVRYPRDTA